MSETNKASVFSVSDVTYFSTMILLTLVLVALGVATSATYFYFLAGGMIGMTLMNAVASWLRIRKLQELKLELRLLQIELSNNVD